MALWTHGEGRYLRDPRLVAPGASSVADLHVLRWDEQGEAHVVVALEAHGELASEPRELLRSSALSGLTHDASSPRVADAPSSEEEARDGAWRVRIVREGARGSVIVEGASRGPVIAWDASAIVAAPAIVATDDGAWIAFHHDLREDDGAPDVVKWIALRFVTREGEVLEPAAPMRERDRDREGEEQGFELPSMLVGDDGAIALFGRGSHRFYRQDLDASGWGPRVALGADEGWGCRGRRVAVRAIGAGRALTARREKQGIVIEAIDAPRGGRPALVPARVVHEGSRPRRDAPRRPDAPDPAARWSRATLFGDIHQHSAHSDGCGVADEPYLRARYGYGDDFVALTDHESFLGKRIGPGEWGYLQSVADRHDDPGSFATLIAYEWTGRRHPGPGHKVVYLPCTGLPIVSRDVVPEGKALVDAVKALGGFAVPHHVGWTGADESAHDPDGQPVWEICSCHGCYLTADHPLGARGDLRDQMVEEVLRRGHRFGFIACSDGHGLLWHHGVARKRDPFRTGLTAVQAKARTRDAILDAIRERRCYATSGVPILLDVIANGSLPMGSEVRASAPVRIEAEAIGTSTIRELSIVSARGVIATARGANARARVECELEAGWAYAKVVQDDGEMAWSSPIFVDRDA
ncbi:CehA/McbA family metallohydrolase [Sandaracinus amylolyticus]|uniref:DUF3604 domain-containing protein n=1 Tax=Sandaracinus amylolyticus TaxID=927083 RepID=A0A0F6W395_9BACT|nr:CehA/McbA family metallohydrolase [Sandaracinus amylolyticus]AKF06381.1 Hypothetical protein DB32_003530 [Sandaracinus amylolyticus]